VQFTVDAATFHALPRHPDWAYEYLDGWAHVRYRPRPLDLVRDLSPVRPAARGARDPGRTHGIVVQRAMPTDHGELVALVDEVWDELDPYRARRALSGVVTAPGDSAGARFCRTLAGDDEPWSPGVLVARAGQGSGPVAGLLTLSAWRRGGDRTARAQPAITWLTVATRWRRAGVATALLAGALAEVDRTGATELHSAVSGTNLPSVCWHWTNGFLPLPRVG
jgi:hypothetical protein